MPKFNLLTQKVLDRAMAHWPQVPLQSVGELVLGGNPDQDVPEYWDNPVVTFITAADIGALTGPYIEEGTRGISTQALEECYVYKVPAGSVLCVVVGGGIGNLAITTQECCTNKSCVSLVCDRSKITSEWAYFCLLHAREHLRRQAVGTNLLGLHKAKLKKLQIALPPLTEQERLNALLGSALSAIAQAEAAYSELVEEQFQQFKLKVAQSAVRDPMVRLADIAESVLYGLNTSAKAGGTFKLLRITDIQDGKVSWDTVPFCEVQESKQVKYQIHVGDVMIARTGSTVGKSFIVTQLPEVPCTFASFLLRIRLKPEIALDLDYLQLFLNSAQYWQTIALLKHGSVKPNLNARLLADKLLIPLPPLEEQQRIVAHCLELLARIKGLTALLPMCQ